MKPFISPMKYGNGIPFTGGHPTEIVYRALLHDAVRVLGNIDKKIKLPIIITISRTSPNSIEWATTIEEETSDEQTSR